MAASGTFPVPMDYVLGFVHEVGAHAVRVDDAVYEIKRTPGVQPDAADAALIWALAELILTKGLPPTVPIFLISTDHIFGTLAEFLCGPAGPSTQVTALSWANAS